MALTLDNVGIVVEDLDAAVGFFEELGLELEGRDVVEGEWAGRVTGLGDQRVEIAMLRTPDGHGRLELSRFLEPAVVALAGSWVGLSGIVGPELGGAPTGPAGTLVSAPGIGAVVVALAVWHLVLAVSLVLGAPWAPPAGIVTFAVTGALALLGALPGWWTGWLLTVADLTAAGLLSAGHQRELAGATGADGSATPRVARRRQEPGTGPPSRSSNPS